jgi:hypothetical protein
VIRMQKLTNSLFNVMGFNLKSEAMFRPAMTAVTALFEGDWLS